MSPAQFGGVECQKPEPRKRTKARADRLDATKLKAFQDAVWLREATKLSDHDGDLTTAQCQRCGRWVFRDVDPESERFGEVDHIIPRSRCTLEQRYDPANGCLYCKNCHRAKHEHRS